MGTKNGYQVTSDVAINSKNNILICGYISGSRIDFDPGPGTYYANAGANSANFIAGYDSNGNFLFESNGQSLNLSSLSDALVLKVDNNDNIISGGYVGGNMKLDSQSDSIITVSNGSIYFMKYSPTGIPLFINIFLSSNQSQALNIESMALDNANNIYMTGEFFGTVDFDPGPNTAYLTSQTSMHSGNNAYLAKYDLSGNYEYAYNFAPIDSFFDCQIYKMDLYVNKNTEIIWGLNASGSIDFDPGPDTFYYHPPFVTYASYNQRYSFAIVKFKQTQTVKPFAIYASTSKPDVDKRKTFSLNKLAQYLK